MENNYSESTIRMRDILFDIFKDLPFGDHHKKTVEQLMNMAYQDGMSEVYRRVVDLMRQGHEEGK